MQTLREDCSAQGTIALGSEQDNCFYVQPSFMCSVNCRKKKTKTDCLIALSAGLARAVPQANRCAVSSFFVATTVRLLLQSSRMGPFTQNMMLMTPPGVCDAYRVLLCILIDTSFQLLLMDKKINSNITPWLLG